MKQQQAECPHKDKIEVFCKRCKMYLCSACEASQHSDHVNEIQGIDSLVNKAVGDYSALIKTCEGLLQLNLTRDQCDAVDNGLLKIEGTIWEKYEEVCKESRDMEEKHVLALRSSPLIQKLGSEKKSLEGETLSSLREFDKSLESRMEKLLGALDKEDYAPAIGLADRASKSEVAKQAESFQSYSANMDAYLEHLQLLRSVKPQIACDSKLMGKIISAKGVFDEPPKILVYDLEAQSVFVYMPSILTTKKYPIVDTKVAKGFAQVTLGYDRLVLSGGRTESGFSSSAFLYVEGDEQLIPLPPMLECRASHSMVARNADEVYVVGGKNSQDTLDSAEYYHVPTKTWKSLPKMNEKKKNAALALFSSKYLYAMCNPTGPETFVEVLDVVEGKGWEKRALKLPMGPPAHCGLVQVNPHELLVFGGENNRKRSKKAVAVDPQSAGFRTVGDLPGEAYFSPGHVVRCRDGRVIALSSDRSRVYSYEPKSSKWTAAHMGEFAVKYS